MSSKCRHRYSATWPGIAAFIHHLSPNDTRMKRRRKHHRLWWNEELRRWNELAGEGGSNQIFLSKVGLSRYISDCGKREDVVFFLCVCENRTGIWGVWNGWLLLYSFRGITCTHVAREGKAPLSSVSGGDLVRAEWHKISLRLWRNGHLPRTLKNLKDWLPQVLTESRHATGRYSLWVQCSEARNTKWRKFDPK